MRRNNMTEIKRVITQASKGFTYGIDILGEVLPPEHYAEDFDLLRNATEQDTINIFINTTGGAMPTATAFHNLITNCKADVIAHVESDAMSAGSLIALSCHALVVPDMTNWLMHPSSGGTAGQAAECYADSKWLLESTERLYRTIYSRIMSEEEIEEVIKGKQWYMFGEEVMERLEKYSSDAEEVVEEVSGEVSEEPLKEHPKPTHMCSQNVFPYRKEGGSWYYWWDGEWNKSGIRGETLELGLIQVVEEV
jgi:ATP-dependent protease ClpP protease subunit